MDHSTYKTKSGGPAEIEWFNNLEWGERKRDWYEIFTCFVVMLRCDWSTRSIEWNYQRNDVPLLTPTRFKQKNKTGGTKKKKRNNPSVVVMPRILHLWHS